MLPKFPSTVFYSSKGLRLTMKQVWDSIWTKFYPIQGSIEAALLTSRPDALIWQLLTSFFRVMSNIRCFGLLWEARRTETENDELDHRYWWTKSCKCVQNIEKSLNDVIREDGGHIDLNKNLEIFKVYVKQIHGHRINNKSVADNENLSGRFWTPCITLQQQKLQKIM